MAPSSMSRPPGSPAPRPPGRARLAASPSPAAAPRRDVLRRVAAVAAGGSWLAACALPSARTASSSSTAPVVLGVSFVPPVEDESGATALAPLFQAYEAAHPGVRLVWENAATSLTLGAVWGAPGDVVDLRPYLERTNFDPASLLGGWQAAFTDAQGRITQLPYMSVPVATWFDRARLAAASIAEPGGNWTISSLASTCAAYALAHPGAPLLDPPPGLDTVGFPVATPLVWTAFVLGFGGALSEGGAVVLTDRGALDGFDVLAGIVGREPRQAPPARGPASANQGLQLPTLFAFWYAARPITTFPDVKPHETAWAVAPFPVLPARPVVPGIIRGLAIPASYPHPAVAAEFLLWVVGPAGQAVMTALGYSSVRAGGRATTNWQARLPQGFDDGGFEYDPADLYFLPFSLGQRLNGEDGAIQNALLQPAGDRLAALTAIETRLNASP